MVVVCSLAYDLIQRVSGFAVRLKREDGDQETMMDSFVCFLFITSLYLGCADTWLLTI